ncbi:alpha/beta hydrolase, partial [Myxococcota bacterium]|nr:alpha/beta hydrolase [Myxococcota bacterium]
MSAPRATVTPPSSSASLTKLGESRSSAPERDLVQLAARAALATAWRGLNPQSRERFAQAPSPSAVDRVWYETQDGWTTPMHRVPAAPGGSGEPVILAHGLGVNRYALDFSPELSLARALSRAGFEVFLLETRADRAAIAPEGAPAFDVDDVALQDLPAAFERACQLTGARRALYVGHALGAQLLYAYAGQCGADEIAAAATLCAPVTFPRQASGARALRLALGLLPQDARLPARAAAAISAPRVGGELPGGLGVAAMSGDVARGMMMFGAEDIP